MTAGNRPAFYENGAKSANVGANQVRSLTFSPFPNPSHMRCALVASASRRPDGQACRILRDRMPGRDRLPVNGRGMTSASAPINMPQSSTGEQSSAKGYEPVRLRHAAPRLDGDRACSLRRGNRPVLTGNEKPSFFPHLFHVFLGWLLRKKASEKKHSGAVAPTTAHGGKAEANNA